MSENGTNGMASNGSAVKPADPTSNHTPGKPWISEETLRELSFNASSMRREIFSRFLDPRRDINDECGYPDTYALTAFSFKDLYDREAVACRVVQLMPKECWQVTPEIFESENGKTDTEFERKWEDLNYNLRGDSSSYRDPTGSPIWEYLQRIDKLSGIGFFGVLLLGIDDGQPLDTPVEGMLKQQVQNGRLFETSKVFKRQVKPIFAMVTNRKGKQERRIVGSRIVGNKVRRTYESIPAFPVNGQPGSEANEAPTHARDRKFSIPLVNGKRQFDSTKGDEPVRAPVVNGERFTFNERFDSTPAGTDAQYTGVQLGETQWPASEPSGEERKLLYIRCFNESLVQIVQYESNPNNPRYGHPVTYRITLNDPNETHQGIGLPRSTIRVHWTRIIHVADNLDDSEIFGVPRMRPALNRLLDLRKLYGGSAEMYWRGAFPGLSIETHPQLGGEVGLPPNLRDTMENYGNGLQRYLAFAGASVKTLAPTVSDPKTHIDTQIEAICIQLGCPKRVFMGSERGELASSQDDASWNDRLRTRQNSYLTPRLIVPFVDRLILLGVLPEPGEGYSLNWPDLDSLTDMDKAKIMEIRTRAYQQFVSGGLESVIPERDFMTRFDHMAEEEADQVLANKMKELQDEDFPPPDKQIAQVRAAAGGAMQSITSILQQYAAGSLSRESAEVLLTELFLLGQEDVASMLDTAVAAPQEIQDISPAMAAQPAPVVTQGITSLLQQVQSGVMEKDAAKDLLITFYELDEQTADKILASEGPSIEEQTQQAEIKAAANPKPALFGGAKPSVGAKPAPTKNSALFFLANYSDDQPRDADGKWAGVGSALSAIWKGVRKALGLDPATPAGKESHEPTTRKVAQQSMTKHIDTAKKSLAEVGVKDMWNTDLSHSAGLRAEAVSNPSKFDTRISKLQSTLTQAAKFAGDNKAAQDSIGRKRDEIAQLQRDVNSFRQGAFKAPTNPASANPSNDISDALKFQHFGERGASKANADIITKHLKGGGDAKSAVELLMKDAGYKESTAKRYVKSIVSKARSVANSSPLFVYNAAIEGDPLASLEEETRGWEVLDNEDRLFIANLWVMSA